MAEGLIQARVDAIKRLARRGSAPALRRTLEKSRPEDIAEALAHLVPTEQRMVFDGLEDEDKASAVLANVAEPDLPDLIRTIEFDRFVALLERMDFDDEADIIGLLPDELREQVLQAIKRADKEQVEEILAWPQDSAGGIMAPLAFTLGEEVTCRDAIAALQEAEDVEMVFYIYVENDAEQLSGVTSLRNLLTHPASTPLKDVMTPEVISVFPETDQEEVARIVGRYDLLAIPVVDQDRRLLGIVTIDDVVDVIKEEAAEDMLLMAGVGEDVQLSSSVFESARQRLLWLMVTLFGGIGMAELIGFFEKALESEAVLAGFIPVMMGMGGNVGIQAATIAVRNLATGHIEGGGALALVYRESRVGALLGISFALILGVYAAVRHGEPLLGVAIATAIVTEVIAAAAFGSLVPLTLSRLGVDPAVATGPFVTTGIDLVAILIYFNTCAAILGL